MTIIYKLNNLFNKKGLNFYKKKKVRLFLRNLIRSSLKSFINWYILSLFEYCNENYFISEYVINFAFFYCTNNLYDLIQYKMIKFYAFNIIELRSITIHIDYKKIWTKFLYEKEKLKRKKFVSNIFFYFPNNIFYCKLITLYYGFDLLISIKNMNYYYTVKEIWMRFCILIIKSNIKNFKIRNFYIEFNTCKYFYILSWFHFYYIKKTLKNENNIKLESFSIIFNWISFFLKLKKTNQISFNKKNNFSNKIFFNFAKNYLDLDYLISKIILSYFGKNKSSEIYVLINFIFFGTFYWLVKIVFVNRYLYSICDTFLLKEFILFYYPSFIICNNKHYLFNKMSKKNLINILNFTTMNLKFLSIFYKIKKYKFTNNFIARGLFEKNKELREICSKKFEFIKKLLFNFNLTNSNIKYISFQGYDIFLKKNIKLSVLFYKCLNQTYAVNTSSRKTFSTDCIAKNSKKNNFLIYITIQFIFLYNYNLNFFLLKKIKFLFFPILFLFSFKKK